MLISHEVPIELLEKSLEFNDYDYCLLHLIMINIRISTLITQTMVGKYY